MNCCDVLLHNGTTGWLRWVDREASGLDSSERLRCFVMNAICRGGGTSRAIVGKWVKVKGVFVMDFHFTAYYWIRAGLGLDTRFWGGI